MSKKHNYYQQKVTGQAKYTDDLRLPNMAYAAVVRSPYSRAKVLSIDISEAEKVPGYLGCLMPEEAPSLYFNCSGNPPSPLLMADETVFTREPKVLGDRIMCVAAETEQAARDAADAVKIEYEVLPLIREYAKDGLLAVASDELERCGAAWRELSVSLTPAETAE